MELKNEEIDRIELRSNTVQEILTRPPRWIIRWGITIIFFVVAIIIIGSAFFRYPDIVPAEIVLTTENPPAPVLTKSTGKIQNLLVANNDLVSKNQVLAVIENPAKYEDVKELELKLVDFILPNNLNLIVNSFKSGYTLGSVQSIYANLIKYIDEYNRILKLDYHSKKIFLYKQELKKYDIYSRNLIIQSNLLEEESFLTEKQYKRDSNLHSQGLLSDADVEKSKSLLISKQYNYEQIKVSITNVELQIESLNQNILELELQKEKQLSDQSLIIEESIENLKSAIDTWKYQFVLTAATEGKVTFNQYWNENQSVIAGETVMTIIPADEGEIIGKVKLNFQGAGKVKNGQQANIQFANYPYMEFGMVQGHVSSISLAPSNDFYTVEIKLNNGLTTFYGIDLEFKQEMKGSAEIITEDLSLLRRIVRPLNLILKKNTKFGQKNN
jgi:HlyD family secretion protein